MIFVAVGCAIILILVLVYALYKKSNDAQELGEQLETKRRAMRNRNDLIKEMSENFAKAVASEVKNKVEDTVTKLEEELRMTNHQIDNLETQLIKVVRDIHELKNNSKEEAV